MAEYIEIGFTKKTHGVDGGLKIDIHEQFLDDFLKAPAVFINMPGGKVPYFLDGIRDAGMLIATFENITSKEKAIPLTGKAILLPAKDISNVEVPIKEVTDFKFLKGFTMIENKAGKVGIIESVEEYPQQEMALVKTGSKTKLIPLHPTLITRIDTKAKKIYCSLPEGLLEL